jgi:hypothetical protein
MRFKKKPVEIEAFQWDATEEALANIRSLGMGKRRVTLNHDGTLSIGTLEGVMTANVNDWIIRGVKGEVYPCKPDIFEATYQSLAATELGRIGGRSKTAAKVNASRKNGKKGGRPKRPTPISNK